MAREAFRRQTDEERATPVPGGLENARRLIEQLVLPPPDGRRIAASVCVSSRLENVYYLDLGAHAVLVDTGFDFQAELHLATFERLGCDVRKIRAVLLSHSHVDHSAGVKRVKELLGIPAVAHRLAAGPVSTGDPQRTAAVIPWIQGWAFDFPKCELDVIVEDGDTLLVGEERIVVRHLPGHNPDSVAYLWQGHLFTGDELFPDGLGWNHPNWGSNYHDIAQTARELIENPPAAARYHPAHGPGDDYDASVPRRRLKAVSQLLADESELCNHTPRIERRDPCEARRTLKIT